MKINPLVVFLFNITIPVAIMFPGNKFQHFFFLGFAAIALLISGRLKRLTKFLLVYAFMSVLQRLLIDHTDLNGKTVSMLLMIFIQFTPCVMMASILIKDYSPGEIISALEPLKIPKSFLISLVIVVRYIPTFKKEFSFMKESMRLRNIPYSIKRPIKSFEYFLVPQLFRCSILADEITSAALTKGITNPQKRTSYRDMKLRPTDYIMCLLLLAGTGCLIIFK